MAEAEGAAGAVQGTGVNVGKGLSQKIGPLPLWGWLAVAGVGIGAYFLFIAPNQQGGQPAGLPLGGEAGGGGGGGGTGGGTGTSTGAYVSNPAWLAAAAASVSQQLGLPLAEVTNYLNEYINGQAPQGSYGAVSTFDQVIAAALQATGQPPQPIVSGSVNPYTNTAGWLSAILAALPAGTSQDIQNQIINLANGTTTTLSQDAANALANAINIVGQGPTPITYTLSGAAGLTQSAINTWDNVFLSLAPGSQTFTNWIANAPTAITSSVDTATLQAIFNYFNTSAGKAAVAAAGGPLGWWQKYLANPSTTPIVAPPTVNPPTGVAGSKT